MIYVGHQVFIPAGNYVQRAGKRTKRKNASLVTVTKALPARDGRLRVFWKSNGYTASTLV